MDFQLSPVFGENMVLQRGKPIAIYGEALTPCRITARLEAPPQEKESSAEASEMFISGPFILYLPPRETGAERILTVFTDRQEERFDHVAVGEVCLAGGQSNMAYSLEGSEEYHQGLVPVSNPEIRLFSVGRNTMISPEEIGREYAWAYNADSGWRYCSPKSAASFSAVGYHFACRLWEALQVPVGIISCNLGGSRLFGWMPPALLEKDGSQWALCRSLETALPEEDMQKTRDYLDLLKEDALAHPDRDVYGIYQEDNGRYSYKYPGRLYAAMLVKVDHFTHRGLLWYQGESDAMDGHAAIYAKGLRDFIAYLRGIQGTDYPILLVQLPPWEQEGFPDWREIAEIQRAFSVEDACAALVTTGDQGGGTDIHPPQKQAIGERLALAALHCVYGQSCLYTGPVACFAEWDEGQVILQFLCGEGLRERVPGEPFELELIDGSICPVKGRIQGETVLLICPPGKRPVNVRYGWDTNYRSRLVNRAGIPAAVFRLAVVPASDR